MVITFVGHGTLHIDENLSNKIVATIKNNITGKENITFYCGGYGDFDNHCASICRELKKEICCEVVFVTPFLQTILVRLYAQIEDHKIPCLP